MIIKEWVSPKLEILQIVLTESCNPLKALPNSDGESGCDPIGADPTS